MRTADVYLVMALAAALLLMGALALAPGEAGDAGGRGTVAGGESELPGEPRDVDVDLLRRKLLEGELSDREALYWRRLPHR